MAIKARASPLAGVQTNLTAKRTSETTALDFVPSWAGQLQFPSQPGILLTARAERAEQNSDWPPRRHRRTVPALCGSLIFAIVRAQRARPSVAMLDESLPEAFACKGRIMPRSFQAVRSALPRQLPDRSHGSGHRPMGNSQLRRVSRAALLNARCRLP
jgi:hypothetical protein